MGSSKSASCNETFREIWKWVDEHNIQITASYIPGKHNVQVNKESR